MSTERCPVEAVGAVVLYLQECRRTKTTPSGGEIAKVAVRAADEARGLNVELRRAGYTDRDVARVESLLLGHFGVGAYHRAPFNAIARQVLDVAVACLAPAENGDSDEH